VDRFPTAAPPLNSLTALTAVAERGVDITEIGATR
jgi:hypothetical protein